jgi:hypothetical protein
MYFVANTVENHISFDDFGDMDQIMLFYRVLGVLP